MVSQVWSNKPKLELLGAIFCIQFEIPVGPVKPDIVRTLYTLQDYYELCIVEAMLGG